MMSNKFAILLLWWISQPAFACSNLTIKTQETRFKICSKLTIKTPERRQSRRSGVFIVNFEHISHFVLVFLLLTLNMQLTAGLLLMCIVIIYFPVYDVINFEVKLSFLIKSFFYMTKKSVQKFEYLKNENLLRWDKKPFSSFL